MRVDALQIPGEGKFPLIKPLVGYKEELVEQLGQFPFDKNVFLMMKFRESNKDLSDYILESLGNHGLVGVRADNPEWNITNNVYNPVAALYCCKYGIALFDEAEEQQAFSPNVAYELGMMHYQRKDCLILRHNSLPPMPFDIIKDLHKGYSKDLQVRRMIEQWIQEIEAARSRSKPNPKERPELVSFDPTVPEGEVRNEIRLESNRLLASNLTYKVLSRGKRWQFSWQIQVQNRSRGPTGFMVRVSFLDADGFELGDSLGIHKTPLEPTEVGNLPGRFYLNSDLAGQVERITARVDTWNG